MAMNLVNFRKTLEQTQFEWKIADIFADLDDKSSRCIVSPSFKFADTVCRLLLTGKMFGNPESARLIFTKNERNSHSIEFAFGLKKVDGSVELIGQGILENDQLQTDLPFIKLSKVRQRRSEMAPSGNITVTISLRFEVSDMPQHKKLKRIDTLSQSFKDLFTTKPMWDITLRVQEKDFQAHKTVLIARSEVFAAMFQHNTAESKSGVIAIPDCDPESFPLFLEYLYTGCLDELSYNNAISLFVTSEKYGVLELKIFCREHLRESLSVENWCEIICLADLYNDENLRVAAQNFFVKNYRSIFHSPDWEQLMKINVKLASEVVKLLP